MAIAVLLYNVVLTSLLTLAGGCGYYLYKKKKHRAFAIFGLMFALYIVDNTLVFCTESVSGFAEVYNKLFISAPSFKTIYFVGLIGCVLYVCYSALRLTAPWPFYIVLGFYAGLLVCMPMIQDPDWMVFFYYLPTQMLLAGVSAWGLVTLKRREEQYRGPFYKSFRKMLVFMLVLSILIAVEDTVVIFAFDVYSQMGLKINNRNTMENLLFIGLACWSIRHALAALSSQEENIQVSQGEPNVLEQTSPLRAFSLAHGLTEREHEILEQLLDGKGQQEISEDLVIALGTVKTHVHNIYQKIDVSKKGQLFAKYQEFAESGSAVAQKDSGPLD